MNTLWRFIKIKGVKGLTNYQASLFGLQRKDLTKNWRKRYKFLSVDDQVWEKLLATLEPVSQNVRPWQLVESKQKLYVIRNSQGHLKIGVSRNVKQRLNSLSTANSEPLILLRVYHLDSGGVAKHAEGKLHKLFKHAHRLGEWFDGGILTIDEIDSVMINKFPHTLQYPE